MIVALRLVYGRPVYSVSAAMLFVAVLVFYLWSGQMLLVSESGLALLVQPDLMVASIILATLFAVSLPLQVYALRLAITGVRQTGGTILGVVIGGVSINCCTPVLLPALLSLAGFSGTNILSVNLTVHRYLVPLTLLGALLLAYSVVSTATSLAGTCAMPREHEEANLTGSGLPA
jgi:hypothetical protein